MMDSMRIILKSKVSVFSSCGLRASRFRQGIQDKGLELVVATQVEG